MQDAEEQLGYTSNTPVYHNNKFHDVVAIANDEVLLLMLKEMYSQEGIHLVSYTHLQLANAKIDEIRNGFSEWLEEQSPQFKERLVTCLLYTSRQQQQQEKPQKKTGKGMKM